MLYNQLAVTMLAASVCGKLDLIITSINGGDISRAKRGL